MAQVIKEAKRPPVIVAEVKMKPRRLSRKNLPASPKRQLKKQAKKKTKAPKKYSKIADPKSLWGGGFVDFFA